MHVTGVPPRTQPKAEKYSWSLIFVHFRENTSVYVFLETTPRNSLESQSTLSATITLICFLSSSLLGLDNLVEMLREVKSGRVTGSHGGPESSAGQGEEITNDDSASHL